MEKIVKDLTGAILEQVEEECDCVWCTDYSESAQWLRMAFVGLDEISHADETSDAMNFELDAVTFTPKMAKRTGGMRDSADALDRFNRVMREIGAKEA